jgi:transcriptional accessory protein Tex/SPT6
MSHIQRAINAFSDELKTKCIKKEMLPRYVMSLDIALTDGMQITNRQKPLLISLQASNS